MFVTENCHDLREGKCMSQRGVNKSHHCLLENRSKTIIPQTKHEVAALSRNAILIAGRRNVSDEDARRYGDAKDVSGSTTGTDSAEEQVSTGISRSLELTNHRRRASR